MSLKAEIYSYLQKEKKLNEQIKNIESNNNSLKKSIQSSDTISTRSINKNDSDVISLEKISSNICVIISKERGFNRYF